MSRVVKFSNLKKKNPKTTIVNLVELSKKAAERGEFVKIDDPNYEIDDLFECY